jgi:ADP-glucose pyrophosphorylase
MKNKKNIPVVILCGGLGTRLREETEFKPKPMVEIGGKMRETHECMGVPMSLSKKV